MSFPEIVGYSYFGGVTVLSLLGVYVAMYRTEEPVTVEDVLMALAVIFFWPLMVGVSIGIGIKAGFQLIFLNVHMCTVLYRSKKCITKQMKNRIIGDEKDDLPRVANV